METPWLVASRAINVGDHASREAVATRFMQSCRYHSRKGEVIVSLSSSMFVFGKSPLPQKLLFQVLSEELARTRNDAEHRGFPPLCGGLPKGLQIVLP